MDPNATLDEIRQLAEKILRTPLGTQLDENLAEDIAGKFDYLDEWLKMGGFMPDAWKRGPEDDFDIKRRKT